MPLFCILGTLSLRFTAKRPREGACRASLKLIVRGAARRFFVGPLAGANPRSARIVDPIRRILVTISERSSGGKDSADSPCEGFLEMSCIMPRRDTAAPASNRRARIIRRGRSRDRQRTDPETQTSRASGGHGRGSRGTARWHCLGRAGAGRPPVRARSGGAGEGLRWASGVL